MLAIAHHRLHHPGKPDGADSHQRTPKDHAVTIAVWTYVVYLVLSATITVWVAETLARHGRVFLIDVFHGNEAQADAVNRLLVAGFYLLNLAGVLFNLTLGSSVTTVVEGVNFLSSKIGLVVTVLGTIHFFNLIVLTAIRRWSQGERHSPRPVASAIGSQSKRQPSEPSGGAQFR